MSLPSTRRKICLPMIKFIDNQTPSLESFVAISVILAIIALLQAMTMLED